MKVLVTGGNGFLGGIVKSTFTENAIQVYSLSRSDGEYQIDLSTQIPDLSEFTFDLVVHCAGKAHSHPKTKLQQEQFFNINYQGTRNLVCGFQNSLPKAFVFISTVSVYGVDSGVGINESQSLQGESPYAKSKSMAETFLIDWKDKNGIPVLILRLPLIAGATPPGNLGKMIEAIKTGKYFSVDGGKARRSMVLAEDVANFIMCNVGAHGVYNLTDGYHPSFRELERIICMQTGKSIRPSIPKWIANLAGKLGDHIPKFPLNSATIDKMTNDLIFDDNKARKELNWTPNRVIDNLKVS